MRFSINVRFGKKKSDNDIAFIDPQIEGFEDMLLDATGERHISTSSEGKVGMLALRIMWNLLHTMFLFDEKKKRAKEELDEIVQLIGVKKHLEYLESEGKLKDVAQHLRKISRRRNREFNKEFGKQYKKIKLVS